jgi:hypothetical protein
LLDITQSKGNNLKTQAIKALVELHSHPGMVSSEQDARQQLMHPDDASRFVIDFRRMHTTCLRRSLE